MSNPRENPIEYGKFSAQDAASRIGAIDGRSDAEVLRQISQTLRIPEEMLAQSKITIAASDLPQSPEYEQSFCLSVTDDKDFFIGAANCEKLRPSEATPNRSLELNMFVRLGIPKAA